MKRIVRTLIGVGVATGGAVALRPGTKAHRTIRHGVELVSRRARYEGGRLTGVRYRLRHGHPDAAAGDDVVADRVRSALGTLTKRLDVPHVHVMVEDGVVLLHGVVDTAAQAVEIEQAALEVFGVTGVESYLHIGLSLGDTRPSVGHDQPSPVLHRMLDAAGRVGIAEDDRRPLVRAVLATFADRLPEGERRHILAHLPPDAAEMFAARAGAGGTRRARSRRSPTGSRRRPERSRATTRWR